MKKKAGHKNISFFIYDKDDLDYKKIEAKMILAARIDDAMKLHKISKIEFAAKMNQVPSVITKWLSGTHNFTIDTLIEIEHALGVKIIKRK